MKVVMAGLHVLGLLVLAVAVPLVYGVGCPMYFYRIGDICMSLPQLDDQTFDNAEQNCKALNSEATLGIVKEYRTQAQIVTFMQALNETQQDIYIGLKATPENPFYTWSDGSPLTQDFTRWGAGQPDGYAFLTDIEYCVVLDNTNKERPGYWYDVPCTESHPYICTRPLDDSTDNDPPIPALRCTGGYLAYGNSACFALYNDTKNYDDAQAACQAFNSEVNLATVMSGYESAVIETLLYEYGEPYAWIGLKSDNNEFGWENGFPIEYTNWGANEPSGQTGEGCVRARIDGDNWDDSDCSDTAAYICRYDKISLTFPTPDPTLVNLTCPTADWISRGENCYLFSNVKTDWGEGNFRCMRQYEGSMLTSITSADENEFLFNQARALYPAEEFLWIGLTRTQTGNNDWGTFEWLDNEVLNYALWGRDEPDGNAPDAPLLQSCVVMSITVAGAGAWQDEVCQFEPLHSVCKLTKQTSYQSRDCGSGRQEMKAGEYCYSPSTSLGAANSDKTWNDAENTCRIQSGNLVSVHDAEEQALVRLLSYGFARTYWLGLRQYPESNQDLAWSDGTTFDITQYSEFPGGTLPDNLADEEDCTELRIWEDGDWGRSACGNRLKFVCKRRNDTLIPKPPINEYPTTGECPQDYFRLGDMCFNLRGTVQNERKSWLAARDDCMMSNVRGATLATITNPGQQALLTAIIKGVSGDMWIGLNGIGIHDQYHWTDETELDYTSWMPGQPDNALPITDPNSASCVMMMNDPANPGLWNDNLCSNERAYLCQSPLVPSGGDPPPLPGNPCPDSRYNNYFDTCFLMENTTKRTFDDARTDCQSKAGDLMSVNELYEVALYTYLLYDAGSDSSNDEAWLGLRRNPTTGVFEWVDNWLLSITKWAPNEPNNNEGDCVALTRDGFWAVRDCSESKFYFCKYPTVPSPTAPGPRDGVCPPNYVEFPGTDKCYLFQPVTYKITKDEGDLKCAVDFNGGLLPSIHSKAEEDFIKTELQSYYGDSDIQIWLGVTREEDEFNTWFDGSVMDYVNWEAGEPTDDNAADNNCVQLDVAGGWSDVQCTLTANFICKATRGVAPPTAPPFPTFPPPKAGCPQSFYRFGDICLSLLRLQRETFADAEQGCKNLNSQATLAIVTDYNTQAQIVSLMNALGDNAEDVYIGLKATPDEPFFTWSDGSPLTQEFTRWGVGQPDGPIVLTDKEYCVVMDNTNKKQPGYWYDVLCTEQHSYICSTPVDDSITTGNPPPSVPCSGDFYGFNGACFNLRTGPQTFASAQAACKAISGPNGQFDVNLATVLNGYQAAFLETLLYLYEVPSAWIGLKTTNNEFQWQIDYPIVYTNWGADEPSGQPNDGCVRARIDGDDWDDTNCLETAAYFCRYDTNLPPYPTPDPDLVKLDCPNSDWFPLGENCFRLSEKKTDWGEANYRCMLEYEGSMLASITSAEENELIFSKAKEKYPQESQIWIGLVRSQRGNDDWSTFNWLDQKEFNYRLWSRDEPDGNDENTMLLEACVVMSISDAGAGAWSDEICQFSSLYSVCKLPKQPTYTTQSCNSDFGVDELKVGDMCYFPSTLMGPTESDKTWYDAENTCRNYGGNLVSIHDDQEQERVQTLSYGFARSYWLGLRILEQMGPNFGWSDQSPFEIDDYSGFPGGQLPEGLADEEDCVEMLIWQNGDWGRSACGNSLKFVCKRKEISKTPLDRLEPYPTIGKCTQGYFQLDNMCFNLRGTEAAQRKSWTDARDDCKTTNSLRGTTLATISNPGQQALLTAVIKGVEGDMWIGLNSIGIHDQYHWTDETELDYTSWMPGQPDNAVPITDPNSATCVIMMNNPNDPGLWNDVLCADQRAYLCQSPLVQPGEDTPLPGSDCTDQRYNSYFETCFLMESSIKRTFQAAQMDCNNKNGDLLSVNDRYEVALYTYLLYDAGSDDTADEAWLGLRRNSDSGVFEWVDNWPMQFTKWAPNEPNNNNGDCVALTRDGFWAVRDCSESKYYYCKAPGDPPSVPQPPGEVCPPNYIEFPGSGYCYLFDTASTKIRQVNGDFTCLTNHNGGQLPSIHSKEEEDFVKAETKKVFGEDNVQIWLGVTRGADEMINWFDGTVVDYVNWESGEPTDDNNANNNCVMLDVNGSWRDVDCSTRTNYICKSGKIPAPPTDPPQPTSSAIKPVAGWFSVLLTGAAIFVARR